MSHYRIWKYMWFMFEIKVVARSFQSWWTSQGCRLLNIWPLSHCSLKWRQSYRSYRWCPPRECSGSLQGFQTPCLRYARKRSIQPNCASTSEGRFHRYVTSTPGDCCKGGSLHILRKELLEFPKGLLNVREVEQFCEQFELFLQCWLN